MFTILNKNSLKKIIKLILVALADGFLFNLAFAFVILLFKNILGEQFGAFLILKNYVSIYFNLTILIIITNFIFGLYNNIVQPFKYKRIAHLLLVTVIEFTAYFIYNIYFLNKIFSIYFILAHAICTFLAWLALRTLIDKIYKLVPKFTTGRFLLTKRTMIVGAGIAGESIAKILRNDPEKRGNPVVFVDDNVDKIGKKLLGIKIAGNSAKIPNIVEDYGVERIIIAIPFIEEDALKNILSICQQTKCEIMKTNFGDILEVKRQAFDNFNLNSQITNPAMFSSLKLAEFEKYLLVAENSNSNINPEQWQDRFNKGKITIEVTPLAPEEILGRSPVGTNWQANYNIINGRTVLIAGCGIIGGAICKKILDFYPDKLIIIDSSAITLGKVYNILNFAKKNTEIIPLIGDVTNQEFLQRELANFSIDYYFTAIDYSFIQPPIIDQRAYEQNYLNSLETLGKYAVKNSALGFINIGTTLKPALNAGGEQLLYEILGSNNIAYTNIRIGSVFTNASSVIQRINLNFQLGELPAVEYINTVYNHTLNEVTELTINALRFINYEHSLQIKWDKSFYLHEVVMQLLFNYQLNLDQEYMAKLGELFNKDKIEENAENLLATSQPGLFRIVK